MIELILDKKGLNELESKLSSIDPRKRGGAIAQAFSAVATETEGYLKKEILAGQVLHHRTGRLNASIGNLVTQNEGDLTALIGSGVRQGKRVPYADIHETGGTIRPKNSQYLAIPLPAALTPAGVLRKKPREYEHTFIAKTNSGNLIIFQRKGKMGLGAIVALFILKKSVAIPARHYLTIAKDAMAPRALEIMSQSIERQLEGKTI